MKRLLQRLGACLTLCVLLAAGTMSPPASAAGTGFQDVPAGHWAAESIQRCVSLGFFQGESASRFGLGEDMTRSAFTVVLCRFFGWETPAPAQSSFSDVPVDAWYAGAVQAAYEHGAVTAQREEFRPGDPITREELAVMLVRALGYGTIAGLAQDLPLPFTDVTTNTGYITMAYDLGLVSGTSDTAFSPDETAPREQVAVILMRLYDKLHGGEPETLAVMSQPAAGAALPDLTGLDAAAIPAARLIGTGGQPTVNASIQPEAAAQMRDAVREAGAKAFLYVVGGPSALDANIRSAAEATAAAAAGYDGVILDIPKLGRADRRLLTQLAEDLAAALGETPLYVVVEAPSWAGETYDGYEYGALAEAADRLVLRIASYEPAGGGFPTAPTAPLEEVYYALAQMQDQAPGAQLTLMLDAAPTVWTAGGLRYDAEASETAALLSGGEQHYSSRYACAYATGSNEDGQELVAWYLDRQAVRERTQLAQAFGVDQLCLTGWDGSASVRLGAAAAEN